VTQDIRPPKAMAVFADSRASALLVDETTASLIGAHGVEHGYVDLITPAGVAAAAAFQRAGIAYTVMDLGPEIDTDDPETERLLGQAAAIEPVDPAEAATMPASVVVVPACVGSMSEHLDHAVERADLDFSLATLPGVVLEALQFAGRDMLMMDAPERGLVRSASGAYSRRVFHVGHAPQTELPGEAEGSAQA